MIQHNLDEVYLICKTCRKGVIEPQSDSPLAKTTFFRDKHRHCGNFDLIPSPIFLSQYIRDGYIDIDRVDLEPITLSGPSTAPPAAKKPPFGMPGGTRTMDGIASLAAEAREEELHTPLQIDGSPLKDDRLPWDHYFMLVANAIKERGSCSRLQVGAVIVDLDHRIVSTGYNGAPRGLPHCDHSDDRHTKDGHCINAEHAERNALIHARQDLRNCTIYTTVAPCVNCCRLMVSAGIAKIVYRWEYNSDPAVRELCNRAAIELVKLQD